MPAVRRAGRDARGPRGGQGCPRSGGSGQGWSGARGAGKDARGPEEWARMVGVPRSGQGCPRSEERAGVVAVRFVRHGRQGL